MDSNPALGPTQAELDKLLAAVAEAIDIEPSRIALDTDLQETGRLDSMALVSIVTFLDGELGVTLAIDQIVPENFASVRRIAELVATSRA
jgi:acyl carrier protein